MTYKRLVDLGSRSCKLILWSLFYLFLIDLLSSELIAQILRYWYHDPTWDPVVYRERKKTPELIATTTCWLLAIRYKYLKLFPGKDDIQIEKSPLHPQPQHNDISDSVLGTPSESDESDVVEIPRPHMGRQDNHRRSLAHIFTPSTTASQQHSNREGLRQRPRATSSAPPIERADNQGIQHTLIATLQQKRRPQQPMRNSQGQGNLRGRQGPQRPPASVSSLSTDKRMAQNTLEAPRPKSGPEPPVSNSPKTRESSPNGAASHLSAPISEKGVSHDRNTERSLPKDAASLLSAPISEKGAIYDPETERSSPNDNTASLPSTPISEKDAFHDSEVERSAVDASEQSGDLSRVKNLADDPLTAPDSPAPIDVSSQHRDGPSERSDPSHASTDNKITPIDVSSQHREGSLERSSHASKDNKITPIDVSSQRRDGSSERSGSSHASTDNEITPSRSSANGDTAFSESAMESFPPYEYDVEDYRDEFVQKLLNSPSGPSEQDIGSYLRYFDLDDPNDVDTQNVLLQKRKKYERLSCKRSEQRLEPFKIGGWWETVEHDTIKCWVFFNLHMIHGEWPRGYEPICSEEELAKAREDGLLGKPTEDDNMSRYSYVSR